MRLEIIPEKCTGCRICEIACTYHRDREISPVSSSILLHRNERKNYFGVVLKRERDIFLARPEGAQILLPGEKAGGEGTSSKPILMRQACDNCEGEEFIFCATFCPSGTLIQKEEET